MGNFNVPPPSEEEAGEEEVDLVREAEADADARTALATSVTKQPVDDGAVAVVRSLDISGHGWSSWKGQQIEFDVIGQYDIDSGRIALTKRHLGLFSNEIHYTGS